MKRSSQLSRLLVVFVVAIFLFGACSGKRLTKANVDQVNQGAYADPIMQKFRDLTSETVFGSIWTRPW